jgi:hypothetical protein
MMNSNVSSKIHHGFKTAKIEGAAFVRMGEDVLARFVSFFLPDVCD